jgi:hypothetical protein
MENRAELLMQQASMTAYTYMRGPKDDIDAMFGEDYDRLEEIAGHLEAIFGVVCGVAAKFS